MKQLKEELKNNQFPLCYLFYGAEVYLKEAAEKNLQKKFQSDSTGDMNLSIFGSQASVNEVMDAVETLPFFAEKRLVVWKESGLFQAGRKQDSERMAAFLTNLPQSTCLVFSETAVDKRNKLYQAVTKVGRAVEFQPLAEKERYDWAIGQMKKRKIMMERPIAARFFGYVGNEMENAARQLALLADYVGEGQSVQLEDIEAVCSRSLETKVFDLIGAVSRRQTQQAVRLYREMLLQKEAPLMILVMLSRQFRLMLQCKSLLSQGMAQSELASALGQNPYAVKQCVQAAKNFTVERLKDAMEACVQADWDIKSGKIKDDLAVELVIVSYGS